MENNTAQLSAALKALDTLYQFTTNVQASLAAHMQAQQQYNIVKNFLVPMPKAPELKNKPPVVEEAKVSKLKNKPPEVK